MEPIIKVYQIQNGFLLELTGGNGSGAEITYCATAKDIAEAIIASATRTKLDVKQQVPVQQEMFTPAQMGHNRIGN